MKPGLSGTLPVWWKMVDGWVEDCRCSYGGSAWAVWADRHNRFSGRLLYA